MSTQSEILRFLLQGESKSLVDALSSADAALDGTETAAQRLAAQMSAMAKVIESEGKQAAAATEALSSAMGADLVAAVERSGGSVQQLVAELHQAGAAYDDLRANAEQVAASLREVDAAGRAASDGIAPRAHAAADGIQRVRTEADQSRSVLANMVGNSAQDMGALAGATGTVGVALGQLAEYAAEGNISMGKLGAMVPVMLAVAGAMYGLSENAKAAAERTEDITEATKELSRVADEEAVRALGRAMADAALNGMSMQELFADMAENNLPGFKRALDLLIESGQGTPKMINEMRAAIADQEAWAAQAAETNREYGSSIDEVTAATERSIAAQIEQNRRDSEAPEVIRAKTTAMAAMEQKLNALANAIDGIPADKYTEIKAAIADGDLERANALIDAVARERVAQITIAVSATIGAQMGMVGQGPAAAAAAAAGAGVASAYQAAVKAAMSTGGGGGGGAGSVAAEEVVTWEEAMARAYEYGEITREQYRTFLAERLAGEKKYTDAYDAYMTKIMALDKEAAAAQRELADAEKRRQDDAEKAAQKALDLAEKQLSATQRVVELLATLLLGDNGNLNMLGPGAISTSDRQQLGGFISDLLREFLDGNS